MKKKNFRSVLLVILVFLVMSGCRNEEEELSLYEVMTETDLSTVQPEKEGDRYCCSFAKEYEETEKGKGFTNVNVFSEERTWGQNYTCFSDLLNDRKTEFLWEGPVKLGDVVYYKGEDPVRLVMRNASIKWEQELTAFYAGERPEEEFLSLSKEEITSLAEDGTPYTEDGYYETDENSYSIAYVYAIGNEKERGYAKYLIHKDTGVCYQFFYVEPVENYNDEMAMRVIDSISFWKYYPEEES